MKVTITDIARHTGLSVSTISKYLNHKPVLPENRKKIEEAIRVQDFTPNRMAQNLRSKNTKTIALVLPSLEHSHYGKLVDPVENQLKSMNYLSFVCTNVPESPSEHSLLEYLFSNHITGILCVGHSLGNSALEKIHQKKIPCVCLDNCPSSFDGDTISADHYQDGKHAARLFTEQGHKQLAVLENAMGTYPTEMRCKGISDACKDTFKHTEYSISWNKISKIQEMPSVLEKLFASSTPTGMICVDYLSSLGLLSAVVNSRIKIPDRFSLFCFDYDHLFEALVPSLCAMNEQYDSLGRKGAELLLKRISFPEEPSCHILVPSQFYQGTSIAPLSI